MSHQLFERYSEFEDGLREEFHAHPLFRSFHALPKDRFVDYLLQVGFLSQHFVKWYETSKIGLKSEGAREVVRDILRDEIPQDGPTHQDDRLYDLNLMGVPTDRVRNVRPTRATKATIDRLYRLVDYPQADYDLRVMVSLRVAGEILVAEQYAHVWRYMLANFGIKPSASKFFFPHWRHDLKGSNIGGKAGHTNAFDELLAGMIIDGRTLEVAMDAARKAFGVRMGLHDQFLPVRRAVSRMRHSIGVAAILALLMVVGWGSFKLPSIVRQAHTQAKREEWQAFLQGLPKDAREFYLSADVWLAKRARETGNLGDLAKVGTAATTEEVYGRGP